MSSSIALENLKKKGIP